MSFTKTTVAVAFAGLLVVGSAPTSVAQVGGGTELPANAEPGNAKSGNGSMSSKSGMKGGSMKHKKSMKKKRHM